MRWTNQQLYVTSPLPGAFIFIGNTINWQRVIVYMYVVIFVTVNNCSRRLPCKCAMGDNFFFCNIFVMITIQYKAPYLKITFYRQFYLEYIWASHWKYLSKLDILLRKRVAQMAMSLLYPVSMPWTDENVCVLNLKRLMMP